MEIVECVEANVIKLFPVLDPSFVVRRELRVRVYVHFDEAVVRDDGAGVLAESQDVLVLNEAAAGFEKL